MAPNVDYFYCILICFSLLTMITMFTHIMIPHLSSEQLKDLTSDTNVLLKLLLACILIFVVFSIIYPE